MKGNHLEPLKVNYSEVMKALMTAVKMAGLKVLKKVRLMGYG